MKKERKSQGAPKTPKEIEETILWIQSGMPDEEMTVLVETADQVDTGFVREGLWCWASGGLIDEPVMAYAELPLGSLAVMNDAAVKRKEGK